MNEQVDSLEKQNTALETIPDERKITNSDNEFLDELDSTLTPKTDEKQQTTGADNQNQQNSDASSNGDQNTNEETDNVKISTLKAYWQGMPRWFMISLGLAVIATGFWQTSEWIDYTLRLDANNRTLNSKLTEALNRIDILKETLIDIKQRLQKLEQQNP